MQELRAAPLTAVSGQTARNRRHGKREIRVTPKSLAVLRTLAEHAGEILTTLMGTTAKTTLSHYQRRLLSADHEWKIGAQIEKGEHHQAQVMPGGVRFIDDGGKPLQAISAPASNSGGQCLRARSARFTLV
jgi:hypothetical protein